MGRENKVVGLRYRPDEGVPQVILKGAGDMAETLVAEARNLETPPLIVRNKELVDQLYRLPTDASITPELYELVALIMAHVFAVNDGMMNRKDKQ